MSATPDETTRQRALDAYRIVDSLPEEAYDDVVRLASMLCSTPIALVSLIDRDRQWFKARTGLALAQTTRDIAFCDHAIRTPERLMEVEDATRDPRFAGNPLVTGEPGLRFYAGMPLVTPSGAAIGTVCVLDREPRELSPQQREALGSLARLTMNLLEGRHRLRELERATLVNPPPPTAEAAPTPVDGGACVVLIELQDHAGAAERLGERAIERQLQTLEAAVEALLQPAFGDCCNRSSGSAESVVVLRGPDRESRLAAIDALAAGFGREHGLRVLCAHAGSDKAGEPINALFLRADLALGSAKDAERADRSTCAA